MARKARVEFAGAVYHVLDRGDRREAIFADEQDRAIFLRTLEQVCRRTGWRLHAYVLMTNHYHFLLETPEANLVAGMKWFQSTYTMRFNRRHRCGGHLFQGRYKAIVVDPEERNYLVSLSDYIHLNPVRAGLITAGARLFSYPWSSYPDYVLGGQTAPPAWLETRTVLGELGMDEGAAGRRRYAERMKGRALEGADEETRERGWCLGGQVFRRRMLALLDKMSDGLRAGKEIDGALRASHDAARAEDLLQRGLKRFALEEVDLTVLKKNDERKIAIGRLIREQTAVSNLWIAERVCLGHVSRVSRYCGGAVVGDRTAVLMQDILSS